MATVSSGSTDLVDLEDFERNNHPGVHLKDLTDCLNRQHNTASPQPLSDYTGDACRVSINRLLYHIASELDGGLGRDWADINTLLSEHCTRLVDDGIETHPA